MSGYTMSVRPVILCFPGTGRPVGFKQGTGLETFFPTFAPDGVTLMRPDGSMIDLSGTAQVQSDWNATEGMAFIQNKPTLFAGTWAALSGKPTLFDGAYTSLTGRPTLFDGNYASLAGKPALFSGAYADLTGKPTIPTLPTYAAVATSGAYSDLSGRPTISTVGSSGAYADLTGKPALFSGDYSDLTNKPAAAPSLTQSAATRALNTIFQPSASRNVLASYSVQITVTASIASGQDGEVVLEIASNAAFTTGVQTVAVAASSQVYTLAVALQGVQKAALQLFGIIPAGYYVRLRTVNTIGTPAFVYRAGQETLL